MPVVNIPNVGRVTFPDSMSQDDITTAIERDILKREQSDRIVRRPETGGAAGAVGPVIGAGPTLGQGVPSPFTIGQPPSGLEEAQAAIEAQRARAKVASVGQPTIEIGATPAQLPRFGEAGSITRGASDIAASIGEFVLNKPEEFLASVYPPTQAAIALKYGPEILKDFAVNTFKGLRGDNEALGRATAIAASIGLPLGVKQLRKFGEQMKVSPDVDLQARMNLSPYEKSAEVVQPTAPQALSDIGKRFLTRSMAAVADIDRQLPAPRTRLPEFSQSTLEPQSPRLALPAPGETVGSTLLPESPLGPREAGYKIQLPVEDETAAQARKVWSKPVDKETQAEGANALRQLVSITDETKTPGKPYQPPTVNVDLRQLERVLQRNTVSKVESWADEVIQDRLKNASANPFLDPEFLAAAMAKGAILFKRGVENFEAWKDEMRKQFGRGFEDYLPTIYDQSKNYWQQKERTPNATGIREDAGQVRQNNVTQTGQAEGGTDLERQAQAQPGGQASGLTPAIQVQGKTFTGEDHLAAYENAKTSGQPDTSGAQEGFVNDKGGFLTREKAAQQTGLPTVTEPGKLHSSDLKNADRLRLELSREGLSADSINALLQGKKSIEQVVEDQLGVERGPSGALDASTIIVEERPDGGRSIGFNPDAGPASTPPQDVGTMSHSDAIMLARDNAVERIQGIFRDANMDVWPSKPPPSSSETVPQTEAPAEPSAVSEASKPEESPPGEAPAISQATTEGEKVQAAAPESDVLGIVPRGTAKGVALVQDVGKRLYNLREGFRQLWEAQPNRRLMEQTLDGAETLAGTEGHQVRRSLELDGSLLDRQAAYAIVEANDTYAKLGQFLTQVRGKNLDATRAVRHAMANYAKLKPLADKVRAILDAQIDMEKQVGLDPEYREAYVPHILDLDLLMGTKRPVVLSGGRGGLSTAFKKGRAFDTIFDAIEAGYNPKSIDVAKVVEHRVRAGQQMINRKMWADSLRTAVDPVDNRPIVTDLEHKSRGLGKPGWEQAPMGYVPKEILPGIRLAVHEGYARYWDALTGQSTLAQSLPGKIALHTEGTIKHGLLLFDTFHASRIAQKELFLTRGRAGYRRGLALLEYGDNDLAKAVAAGDITPEMARYARANRPTADLLMKSGLNVGKIQEALYSGFVRQWPVIGTFNKWVFEKLTRGAMLESGIIEFDRLKQANPTWTDAQTAQYAARRLNQLFGNLGRQGMFKSAGARDAARLFFLAPQWVESMARTELGGLRELTVDPIAKRQSIIAGTLARSVGQGLAAYLVGTQLLNLATRGNLTWDNPEKGHKLDAWIPDITGRTNGFFISPLSVVAELSHDIVRYLHSEGSLLKAGSRILSNKFSPFLRAEEVLRTGETPTREKIPDDWTRLLYAGFALAPTPIPASPLIHSDYPGQIQRQLTASAGFKTEPAPTYVQRMSELAQDFAKSQGRDKPIEMMHVLGTGYGDLRAALRRGDDTTARQQLEKLRGAHTDQEIRRAFELYVSRPFTGTLKMESKFKASLTPEERAAYDSAKDEKRLMLSRLKGLLRE